jgi:hypothetical protein
MKIVERIKAPTPSFQDFEKYWLLLLAISGNTSKESSFTPADGGNFKLQVIWQLQEELFRQ